MRKEWDTYTVHYRFHETVYHITFNRIKSLLEEPHLLLDGQVQNLTNILNLYNDSVEHSVEVWI